MSLTTFISPFVRDPSPGCLNKHLWHGGWLVLVLLLPSFGASPTQGADPAKIARRTQFLQQAEVHRRAGKEAEMLAALKEVVNMDREIHGSDAPEVLDRLRQYARYYENRKMFAPAQSWRREAQELALKKFGPHHWQTRDSQRELADLQSLEKMTDVQRTQRLQAARQLQQALDLRKQKKAKDALPLALAAVNNYRAAWNGEHPELATALQVLALIHRALDDQKSALEQISNAVETRRRLLGNDHPHTALALGYLGAIYLSRENYRAAMTTYEEVLRLRVKLQGKEDSSVDQARDQYVQAADRWAQQLEERDLWADASKIWRAVLEVEREFLGDEDWETTDARMALANSELMEKMPPEQRDRARQARQLFEAMQDLDEEGHTSAALDLARRAEAERRAVLGPFHPDTLTALSWLASAYEAEEQMEEALSAFRRCVAGRRAVLGVDHPDTAGVEHNLAAFLKRAGDQDSAAPLFRSAWATRLEAFGDKDQTTLDSADWLASIQADRAYRRELEKHWVDARDIREEVLAARLVADGPNHWRTINARESLRQVEKIVQLDSAGRVGAVNALQYLEEVNQLYLGGRLPESLKAADQGLALAQRIFGTDNITTANLLSWQAFLHHELGNAAAARAAGENCLAIRRRILGNAHPLTASAANLLGDACRVQRDFATALPYLEEALATRKKVWGESHADIAFSYSSLGWYWADLDPNKAKTYFEQALAVRREVLGDDHRDTITLWLYLGQLELRRQKPTAALPYLQEAYNRRANILGEKHPDTLLALRTMGEACQDAYDFANARRHFEKVLTVRFEVLGDNHPDTANAHADLGYLLRLMGDYRGAKRETERALAIVKAYWGENHPRTASALFDLGTALFTAEEYALAAPLLQQAHQLYARLLGKDQTETLTARDALANLYYARGEFAAARAEHEAVLEARRRVLGKDHYYVARSLQALATLLARLGDFVTARAYLEEARRIHEKWYGENHPFTAWSRQQLGRLDHQQGDLIAARRQLDSALTLYRQTVGERHPDTARVYMDLAELYRDLGDNNMATLYIGKSVPLYYQIYGRNHPSSALALSEAGFLFRHLSMYKQARENFEAALKIYQRTWGEQHPSTFATRINLAMVLMLGGEWQEIDKEWQNIENAMPRAGYSSQVHFATLANIQAVVARARGEWSKAEKLCREVLALAEQSPSDRHGKTNIARSGVFLSLLGQQRWAEAAAMMDLVRRDAKQHLSKVLVALPEREQLAYLQRQDVCSLYSGLELGRTRGADTRIAELSATWLLNAKGQALDTLTERSAWLRRETNPQRQADTRALLALRAEMAARILQSYQHPQGKANIEELTRREQQLLLALGGATKIREQPWVSLEEVRQAIPANAVIIDLARVYTGSLDWTRPKNAPLAAYHYVAWVIPPAGKSRVRVLDLGPEQPVLDAITRFRAEISRAPTVINEIGEQGAFAQLRIPLQTLSRLFIAPLVEATKELTIVQDNHNNSSTPQWIICPDGALWLLPFEALLLSNDVQVLEKVAVQYCISGRALLTRPEVRDDKRGLSRASGGLVLANPDYDQSPAVTNIKTNALLLGKAPPDSNGLGLAVAPRERGVATRGEEVLPKRWPLLPGTEVERQRAQLPLQKYLGEPARTLTGAAATKMALWQDRAPKVLLLSTHGFFLPDPPDPVITFNSADLQRDTVPVAPNPLLRCGLVFAGANRAEVSPSASVVTGLEIADLNLRGTELVVLSACETGVGTVRQGEGVASLRQAFHLAGARDVVASLWRANDEATAALMGYFWEEIAQGKPTHNALRQAQLRVIREQRAQFGAAHPYFWASFTSTRH